MHRSSQAIAGYDDMVNQILADTNSCDKNVSSSTEVYALRTHNPRL